jgi:class 3 adenylate cyclase
VLEFRSISRLVCFLLLFACFNVAYGQSTSELFKEGKEYREDGKKKKAIKSFELALDQAQSERNVKLQMSCHLELAELKDNVVNYKEALDHYKAFSSLYKKEMTSKNSMLADSVNILETEVDKGMQEISNKEKAIDSLTTEMLREELSIKDLEISNHIYETNLKQQELEIEKSEHRRNFLIGIVVFSLLVLLFFGLGYVRKRKTNKTLRNKNYQIAKEKEKSDELLVNILPVVVAEELKEFGKTTSSSFENTTIMFTDFKGFTKFAEKHSPSELVEVIDKYFRVFDEIIHQNGIEKIKTIGDAYMCVSGIPEKIDNHASIMIKAAKEIQQYVLTEMSDLKSKGLPYLEMRIGIHSGPLVAGVVGSKKFAYDVWGDSVNIAARMEQAGSAGAINTSESTMELAKADFKFEYRGEIEAKNKGKLKMYFVS